MGQVLPASSSSEVIAERGVTGHQNVECLCIHIWENDKLVHRPCSGNVMMFICPYAVPQGSITEGHVTCIESLLPAAMGSQDTGAPGAAARPYHQG